MTSPENGPDSSCVGVDTSKPSLSRVYDYLLGGGHNFAADRLLAERILAVVPDTSAMARASRSFLRRAVLYMIEQGVTQFIELGTGIPTVGNVHEIARGVTYESRVVYVECDAVAISHLDLLVGKDTPGVAIVQAKINDPDVVLASVRTSELIDFTKPIGLLLPTAAHVLRDPGNVIDSYRQKMPIGSYFALAHVTADSCPELQEAADFLAKYVTFYHRSVSQIRDLFNDMCMIEPGLVPAGAWRPELDAECESVSAVYAGVGRIA